MTVHSVVVMLILGIQVLECLINPRSWGRTIGLGLRLFLLLPLSFGSISVLAHILFEFTPTLSLFILVPYLVLWMSVIFLQNKQDENRLTFNTLLTWLLYGLWFVLMIIMSAPELGPPPMLFDSTLTTIYWISTLMVYALWLLKAYKDHYPSLFILTWFSLAAFLVYLSV